MAGFLWMSLSLSAALAQQQVLLIQRSWWESGTQSYSDCVEVQSEGSYHFEHTAIFMGKPEDPKIHSGKLSDDEMKQLKDTLDSPALQSLSTPNPGKGAVTGTDVWWVSVSRGDQTQRLWFASTSVPNLIPASRLPSVNQTPAMKPLVDWYKQISKRKDDIDKTAKPTCSLEVRRR
jgi:hypothetical protein